MDYPCTNNDNRADKSCVDSVCLYITCMFLSKNGLKRGFAVAVEEAAKASKF